MILLLLACVDEVPVAQKRVLGDTWTPCTLDDVSIPLTYAPTTASTVKEDDQGIVHIYAQNDPDLFFAAGYEQGRQRLYQIDRARHSTRGTLSEIDGESAVNTDIIARTFNFLDLGCRTLKFQADKRPDDMKLGVAFTAGLNRYVEDLAAGTAEAPSIFGQDQLTYIPEPFTVLDVVAMGKRINLGYSNQLEYDLLVSISDQLVSDFASVPVWQPARSRFIVDGLGSAESTAATAAPSPAPRDPADFDIPDDLGERLHELTVAQGNGNASNNWAFNGKHTNNGKPVMGNDPHATLNAPSLVIAWHLNSADAGGNFDVAGFSFPGVPGVHLGHNRDVNWVATTNFADVMDLFDVNIDEDGFADMGGVQTPVHVREETIRVLQSDGSLLDTPYTMTDIPGHGVLIPAELLPIDKMVFADGEVMVAWAGFEPETQELFQYLDFDRSASKEEFREAVGLEMIGQQNWVFADATGIGYQTHGHIPVRGGDPRRIQKASDASLLWTGEFLDESLYPSLDGSQDFIGTANNAPFDHIADNDPTNDAFYYGSYFDPGWRADRIDELATELVARGNVSIDDMAPMQRDVNSGLGRDLLPLMLEVCDRIDTDESLADYRERSDIADALARLHAWDGNMTEASEEAAIFHTWQAMLARRTLFGDMSVLFDAIAAATPVTIAKLNTLAYSQELSFLLDGKGDTDTLASLSDAVEWIEAVRVAKGLERVTWGDIHTARFNGYWIEDPEMAFSGDESTVNVADCPAWDGSELNQPCASHEGSIYRGLVQFGEDDVPELWFHVGYGGYGALDDWHDFEYQYFNFRAEEVEAAMVRSWVVEP